MPVQKVFPTFVTFSLALAVCTFGFAHQLKNDTNVDNEGMRIARIRDRARPTEP